MQSGPSKATLQPFDARPLFERVRASLLELLADLPDSECIELVQPAPGSSAMWWLIYSATTLPTAINEGRESKAEAGAIS